jgi:hypothetical protein
LKTEKRLSGHSGIPFLPETAWKQLKQGTNKESFLVIIGKDRKNFCSDLFPVKEQAQWQPGMTN